MEHKRPVGIAVIGTGAWSGPVGPVMLKSRKVKEFDWAGRGGANRQCYFETINKLISPDVTDRNAKKQRKGR